LLIALCIDVDTIQKNVIDHVEYTLARTKHNFDSFAAYQATAYTYVTSPPTASLHNTITHHTATPPHRHTFASLHIQAHIFAHLFAVCETD
jgi:starch phosphorylase